MATGTFTREFQHQMEKEEYKEMKKPKISDNLKNRLTNCNVNLGNIEENPNVVMISIATSNYRNIYITGDNSCKTCEKNSTLCISCIENTNLAYL